MRAVYMNPAERRRAATMVVRRLFVLAQVGSITWGQFFRDAQRVRRDLPLSLRWSLWWRSRWDRVLAYVARFLPA